MSYECTTCKIGPCVNCGDDIPVTASECPRCEYRRSKGSHVTEIVHLIAGNFLTLTVIGAVLGLPLMYRALRRLQQRSHEGIVQRDSDEI